MNFFPAVHFTATEVAEQLGKHKSTVCRCADGIGVGQYAGRTRLFNTDDIRRIRKSLRQPRPYKEREEQAPQVVKKPVVNRPTRLLEF